MDKELLKKRVCEVIDANKDKICEIGQYIFSNPELGYKEFLTSDLVQKTFDELNLSYEKDLAITGVKAKLNDKTDEMNVAIVAELDSVMCPEHPFANKETGAAHCCGHFAQITSMLAAAMGLSAVKDEIDYGNVTFLAVPAEECVEIEWRQQQIKEGKFSYLGGKQEFLHLGLMNDVDMAMLVHGMNDSSIIKATSNGVGFIAKTVKFIGKEAHAGIVPWEGVNALDAASLALMAINSVRSTLKGEDCIKIHPILTKGGTLVNIIPNDVRMEMYIRGATIEAIKDANFKVNRAVKGCAYAIGCDVEIIDMPGYLPLNSDLNLGKVFEENANFISPETRNYCATEIEGISSDIGDLSTMIPVIGAGCGGFINGFHSKDFEISDENLTYIVPAKILACTIIDLLDNQGEKAKYIKENFKSTYSMNEYDNIWKEIMKQD